MSDISTLALRGGGLGAQVSGLNHSPSMLQAPSATTFAIGSPVTLGYGPHSNGKFTCEAALGVEGYPSTCAGFALAPGVVGGAEVPVQQSGLLKLQAAEWTNVQQSDEQTPGLLIGATYFLSATEPGRMSRFRPLAGKVPLDVGGGIIIQILTIPVQLGKAIDTTTLDINIQVLTTGDGLTTVNGGVNGISGLGQGQVLSSQAIATQESSAFFDQTGEFPVVGEAASPGSPVYTKASDGKMYNGLATSLASATLNGLSSAGMVLAVEDGLDPSVCSPIVMFGLLTLTAAQWNAVITGATTGLTPGSAYYLSAATSGFLTKTPPAVGSQWVVKVGSAMSPTVMCVQICAPVQVPGG